MNHGERFNSLSHLLGLGLALVGLVLLITQALRAGDPIQLLSFTVFGCSMILLYGTSTLYHSHRGRAKERWAKADHCAIYLLIAGTYTPFALVTLHSLLGWILFGLVWSLAVIGILNELLKPQGSEPSTLLYVLMGWCGIVASLPLVRGLHHGGWIWLLLGCLSYSVGVAFYVLGRRRPHAHGIWHVFVMGGTASHFFTVLRFVS
jgi:hemolysin III